jgi:hypothetical protein
MKKETQEEAAERIYPTPKPYVMGIDIGNSAKREGFITGAKWQAERMYSEENLKSAFFNGGNMKSIEEFNYWFEQFKK